MAENCVTIEPTPLGAEDEASEAALIWLDDHAEEGGRPFIVTKLGFHARRGEVRVGSIYATIVYDWVYLKYLAVAAGHRRAGVGARLVAAVEARGRSAGAIGVCVDTYEHQAPGFYEALGFTEFGALTNPDPGKTRRYFAKRLREDSG